MANGIYHGTIANPRAGGVGLSGETDFNIKTTLRMAPGFKDLKKIVLPRYLPVENKDKPPHYLMFCDVDKDKLDPYRGIKLADEQSAEYIKRAIARSVTTPVENLEFFFGYLEHPDPEVARDAFLEFAKAADADIQKAAKKLDPEKLRKWLLDPKTPPVRLGVYALLLGACGKEADIKLLRDLLDSSKEERYINAADGLLAGYMQQYPKEGWKLIHEILGDGRKPLLLRLALLRTIRYYQGAQPTESKASILAAMKILLNQGELADLAIEDMRRWNLWDLSDEVMASYDKKGFDAPIMRRTIIRYALCAKPTAEVTAWLKVRRMKEAEEVKEVEQGLEFERRK
jgi:hypothetical protein